MKKLGGKFTDSKMFFEVFGIQQYLDQKEHNYLQGNNNIYISATQCSQLSSTDTARRVAIAMCCMKLLFFNSV